MIRVWERSGQDECCTKSQTAGPKFFLNLNYCFSTYFGENSPRRILFTDRATDPLNYK